MVGSHKRNTAPILTSPRLSLSRGKTKSRMHGGAKGSGPPHLQHARATSRSETGSFRGIGKHGSACGSAAARVPFLEDDAFLRTNRSYFNSSVSSLDDCSELRLSTRFV